MACQPSLCISGEFSVSASKTEVTITPSPVSTNLVLTSRPSLILANKVDLSESDGEGEHGSEGMFSEQDEDSGGRGANGRECGRDTRDADIQTAQLLDAEKALAVLRQKTSIPVLPISAKKGTNLETALTVLRFFVEQQEEQEQRGAQQQQQQPRPQQKRRGAGREAPWWE